MLTGIDDESEPLKLLVTHFETLVHAGRVSQQNVVTASWPKPEENTDTVNPRGRFPSKGG